MGLFDPEEKESEFKEEKKTKSTWKIIRTIAGKNVLVEYARGDEINRVLIPLKSLDRVTDSTLDAGVQFGLKWSKVIEGADKHIESELHRAGIYTREDFITLGPAARSVLKQRELDFGTALKDINKLTKDGG